MKTTRPNTRPPVVRNKTYENRYKTFKNNLLQNHNQSNGGDSLYSNSSRFDYMNISKDILGTTHFSKNAFQSSKQIKSTRILMYSFLINKTCQLAKIFLREQPCHFLDKIQCCCNCKLVSTPVHHINSEFALVEIIYNEKATYSSHLACMRMIDYMCRMNRSLTDVDTHIRVLKSVELPSVNKVFVNIELGL